MVRRRWQFVDSLAVRVTGVVLALIVLSAAAWLLWVRGAVLPPDRDAASDHWWEELAEDDVAELAAQAAPLLRDRPALEHRLVAFGDRVRPFEAEVVVADAQGRVVATSDPDSLGPAVGDLDPALLASMSGADWDFGTVVDRSNWDAYVNRIFQVEPLAPGPDGRPGGWLVASYFPVILSPDELDAASRGMGLLAGGVALAAAALGGVLATLWLRRRVRVLSRGVEAYAGGDLAHRVPAGGADDLGRLGRHVNAMAARLESLVEDLKGKERFQRQLVANISHDLRSPLASLRGYVETLAMGGEALPADERRRYLEIITGNLDHLDRLIDHLLQLSRLDAGQARFNMEDFPLPELVDDLLERFGPAALERQVELRAEVAENVPLVHADPLQISQVLQNLVDNAIKFNRPGGHVTVAVAPAGAGVRVFVRDDGEGIPPEIQPRIFDRFYTADTARRHKGQSSGLGLAIAQKIVQGHGEVIRVESRPGEGSEFSFALPAAAAAADAAQA